MPQFLFSILMNFCMPKLLQGLTTSWSCFCAQCEHDTNSVTSKGQILHLKCLLELGYLLPAASSQHWLSLLPFSQLHAAPASHLNYCEKDKKKGNGDVKDPPSLFLWFSAWMEQKLAEKGSKPHLPGD